MFSPAYNRTIMKGAIAMRGAKKPEKAYRMEELLDCFSMKELQILFKHEDLITKVDSIAGMTDEELVRVVKEEYGAEFERFHSEEDTFFVGFDRPLEALPTKYPTIPLGIYLSLKTGELQFWARKLLLHEVRINLWMRYIEHKAESAKEKRTEEYGQYI